MQRPPVQPRPTASHRGILKAFNSQTHKATVQLTGRFTIAVSNIPVSRDIPTSEMIVGRYVDVAIFNPTNPRDSLVVGVYTP